MSKTVRIRKVGNSSGFIVPTSVLSALGWSVGQEIEVSAIGGKLVADAIVDGEFLSDMLHWANVELSKFEATHEDVGLCCYYDNELVAKADNTDKMKPVHGTAFEFVKALYCASKKD
ncbi:hypothetical protein MHM93_14835 [Pseudoalteromonas sp. MM17-2]|uniref:AbrB/MazE/SpoVT family DNA-binding domain-containing protein n=1 Tax=Pseudoalteromonas sp. MM17-2 TaxID=2917753 RepID=UPI001EF72191|nr:hypothetical protein [Pseudoalteromonas sp. MM17-2]MCG7545455.1 hypothetical protein [Pseudoalteromonas sp. MM17-2]